MRSLLALEYITYLLMLQGLIVLTCRPGQGSVEARPAAVALARGLGAMRYSTLSVQHLEQITISSHSSLSSTRTSKVRAPSYSLLQGP